MKKIQIKQLAKRAYVAISTGGLSLVKMDVGYTFLGHSEFSVRKLYQLKNRPVTKTCLVAGNLEILADATLVSDIKILEWIEMI